MNRLARKDGKFEVVAVLNLGSDRCDGFHELVYKSALLHH